MNEVINSAIEKYYLQTNNEEYLMKCGLELDIKEDFGIHLDHSNVRVIKEFHGGKWPSSTWTLQLNKVTDGKFEVDYSCTLKISKLETVYYLQHEFQVKNCDVNALSPVLDGFDVQPYSKEQFNIDEHIERLLGSKGYTKLSFSEMNFVIPELSFKDGITIFGPQVTVEYALFHDLLNLC